MEIIKTNTMVAFIAAPTSLRLLLLVVLGSHCSCSALRANAVAHYRNNIVDPPPPSTNCSAECSGAPTPLNETIPNVLLVSDSIGAAGTGYFTNVVNMLGWNESDVTGGGLVGNAQVQHSGFTSLKGFCGTSFGVLACAKQWCVVNLEQQQHCAVI